MSDIKRLVALSEMAIHQPAGDYKCVLECRFQSELAGWFRKHQYRIAVLEKGVLEGEEGEN